jgi:hypothetical protein
MDPYFDVATGEQVGWELLSTRGERVSYRVCGGIVPSQCSRADEAGFRGIPPATPGACPIPACTAPPCADNAPCSENADCASGWCYVGYCRPVVTDTCSNGVLDGSETDVDCGGVCEPCPQGAHCTTATDCISNVCFHSVSHLGVGASWCVDPADAGNADAAPDASGAGGD